MIRAVADDDKAMREWAYDSDVMTDLPNTACGPRLSILGQPKFLAKPFTRILTQPIEHR